MPGEAQLYPDHPPMLPVMLTSLPGWQDPNCRLCCELLEPSLA